MGVLSCLSWELAADGPNASRYDLVMARKSRKDWIDAGFAALVKQGVDALAAERLAAKLGVTRGSFYHHFGSADDYARALLSEWERTSTEQIIAFSRVGGSAAQRERRLADALLRVRHDLDVAIRAWALRDPLAQAYQARVDARRIEYLAELYAELLGEQKAARLAAEIVYLCFVGSQQMRGRRTKKGEALSPQIYGAILEGVGRTTAARRRRGTGKRTRR
jgi:AcrR family transcriptional regulator